MDLHTNDIPPRCDAFETAMARDYRRDDRLSDLTATRFLSDVYGMGVRMCQVTIDMAIAV